MPVKSVDCKVCNGNIVVGHKSGLISKPSSCKENHRGCVAKLATVIQNEIIAEMADKISGGTSKT